MGHGQVIGSGWFDIYRGPALYTSLVKNLTVHSTAGTAGALTLWLASAGRSVALWSVGAAVPGIYVFPSQVTIPSGSNLTFQLLTAITVNYSISGAVLEGAQPLPPQPPASLDLGGDGQPIRDLEELLTGP